MKSLRKRAAILLRRQVCLVLAVLVFFGSVPVMALDGDFTLDGSYAVFELENGQTTGSVSDKIEGYGGSGYVTGLNNVGSSVSFDVNVTKTGIYGLSLRSALYVENQALGKTQSGNPGSTYGNVTDGNPERGSYWYSGTPVNPENPKWLMLDLGMVMPVHMVRIRVVTDWGARTQTYRIEGSVDNENFFTLKDTATYQFTPKGRGDFSGNYADAYFEMTDVRYIRLVFTQISDTGTNGAQVGEFEVYTPVRSAELYLDGNLISEFYMNVDPNNIVEADWDKRMLSWIENEIGELALSTGKHNIAIKVGGALPGRLNLDSVAFTLKAELEDEDVVKVINLINAIRPIYLLTKRDEEQINKAKAEFDKLNETQKELVPQVAIDKLNAAIRRIGLIGEDVAITDLVCYDTVNAGGWKVMTNLQIGDISHSDRTFTFNHVPPELWGCDWIRPAMETKRWNAGSTLVSFEVGATTNLYVAWDRSAPVGSWLSEKGFTKTNLYMSITNTDNTIFDLYVKPVNAGDKIELGYLGMDKAIYIVLLEHFTMSNDEGQFEDTTEYPVLDHLTVGDSANDAKWSIEDNLRDGIFAYGDNSLRFTTVPEFLVGSAWIKPASASGSFTGDELANVTINRDGYLYLAVSENVTDLSFTQGFEKTEATIKVGDVTYELYRKYVHAGSVVSLPAQGDGSPCYIPIMKSNVTASAPDRPAISRFMAPFDTDGWYFVREGLNVGSKLFTNTSAVITELPDKYKGCDYIQTYRDDKKAIYFYSEREVEIAVTVDTRISPSPAWLMTWEDSGDVIKAGSVTYKVYTKVYMPGTFITIPILGNTSYDNYIVIARPVDAGKPQTNNPVVPKGTKKETVSPYTYYINDVFNIYATDTVPSGYTLKNGSAKIVAANEATLVDLAFRKPYTYSSATQEQLMQATDGILDTYWEAAAGNTNSFLAVNLGSVKDVNTIVLKVRSHWGARTQTFSVEGSTDGENYTELVASKGYEFNPNTGNTVTVTLPEGTKASHIRLSFSGNTGAPGAQVSEFQVFGTEKTGVDKYLTLTKDGEETALLERAVSIKENEKIVLEYKVKSSAGDRDMRTALRNADGEDILTLVFARDGYLKATNGDSLHKVTYYQPNTWYTIKLVIDLESGKYDVWVDHLRRKEGFTVNADGDVTILAFEVRDEGTLSIDNLRLYDNPERYLLTEDFNGAVAIPAGWIFSKDGSGSIADVPFVSDKSLQLTADGSAAKAIRELPTVSGLFSFEVKVKIKGIGFAAMPILTDENNNVVAGVAFYHNSLFAINGDNWVKVMDGASPWAYYPANNWYKVKLVVDTDTKRYDVYVDGALRMKDLSFGTDVSSVSRAAFTLGTDNIAYIDSMYMYMGSSLAGGLIDKDNIINVKDYGAKGDGVTDDTLAIQRALDDAAYTGKTVLLENGIFKTSTIQVKSDTTLFIAPDAKILGFMEKNNYPLIQSCEGLINYRQIGRGLVITENATNVRIEGGGTIDGNGFYGYRVNDPATDRRIFDARPCVILSILSKDVTIKNVDLINSAFWTLVPMESYNVTIRNVNVNSMNTPNRDGIDPCDVINITIENCNIIAGDDGLCFKSSSLFGTENIDVRNITIQSRSNGIKFGSDSYGSLRNLTITDVTMKNVVKAGITMQSADGAEIENLRFERVTMNEVDDAIFFSVGNRGRQPVTNPGMRLGYIRDVVFKDITFTNAMMPPHSYDTDVHEVLLIGLNDEHKIENVLFENVYLEMPGGYTTVPAWPNGVGSGYPEHYSAGGKSNAWAYCLKYADNVQFINCTNVLINDDVRPEITYYDGYSDEPAVYDKAIRYILPARYVVEAGTTIEKLGLPETVDVVVGFDQIVSVPVTWKANGTYNPYASGTYTFTGTLSAVDGIINPQNLKANVTVTVMGDLRIVEKVPVVHTVTVEYGTEFDNIALPDTVIVTWNTGETEAVSVIWSSEGFDPTKSGTYTIYGTLQVADKENPNEIKARIIVVVSAHPDAATVSAVKPITGITVPYGTEFANLNLPKFVQVLWSNGEVENISVIWENAYYNPTKEGKYTLVGRLDVDASLNPNGVKARIDVTVGKKPAVAKVSEVEAIADITVNFGTAFDSITLPSTVQVKLTSGETITVSVVWSGEGYDPNKAGTYTVYGTLDLTAEQNPNEVKATVKIIVKDKPAAASVKEVIVSVELGTEFGSIGLPATVEVTYNTGEKKIVNVTWSSEGYDPTKAGTYTISGTLDLPEGENTSGLKATAKVTVKAKPTAKSVKEVPTITVNFGTAFDSLNLPATVEVTLDNGEKKVVNVVWSSEGYNPNAAGTYTISGTLDLPEGENPTGLKATVKVTVKGKSIATSVKAVPAITVDFGTAFDSLNLPAKVEVTFDNGEKRDVSVVWSTEGYDPKKEGEQTVYGTLDLTAEENPNGLKVSVKVTVKEKDNKTLKILIPAVSIVALSVVGVSTLLISFRKKRIK